MTENTDKQPSGAPTTQTQTTRPEKVGDRASQFLAAFNDIEQHLRALLRADRGDGFTWMVRLATKKGLISQQHSDALQAFADLRNAISHGTYDNGRPIADPLPRTVEAIEKIRDIILNPPTAMQVLGEHKVETLSSTDNIRSALRIISRSTISQFPVIDNGKYVALLTTNTIARWVAADLDDNDHLDALTVREVLDYAENNDHAEFAHRNIGAQEAVDILTRPGRNNGLPKALIITENGKITDTPLRIVGGTDIKTLIESVTLKGNVT